MAMIMKLMRRVIANPCEESDSYFCDSEGIFCVGYMDTKLNFFGSSEGK